MNTTKRSTTTNRPTRPATRKASTRLSLPAGPDYFPMPAQRRPTARPYDVPPAGRPRTHQSTA